MLIDGNITINVKGVVNNAERDLYWRVTRKPIKSYETMCYGKNSLFDENTRHMYFILPVLRRSWLLVLNKLCWFLLDNVSNMFYLYFMFMYTVHNRRRISSTCVATMNLNAITSIIGRLAVQLYYTCYAWMHSTHCNRFQTIAITLLRDNYHWVLILRLLFI